MLEKLKHKIIFLGILLAVVVLLSNMLPLYPAIAHIYDIILFYPIQSLRECVFGFIPFSLGDLLYIAAGARLLYGLIMWVKMLLHFRESKFRLAESFIKTLNIVLFVYVFFLLGWGANYYKKPLREAWDLNSNHDTIKLSIYDSTLVDQINILAPLYTDYSIANANKIAIDNYLLYTDSRVTIFGQPIKTSVFSYFLDRMAIEGYYNPFTGEGQISSGLPHFMLPYVVSHEMAHQAGIAAEGDANLLAYALCTASLNPTFRYSAKLNIWMYVDRRLHHKDSILAKYYESRLNKLTLSQIDTLDSLSKLYDNDASRYGGEMYDSYLKMHHQQQGIKSYGNVMSDAWRLEQKRKKIPEKLIHVP